MTHVTVLLAGRFINKKKNNNNKNRGMDGTGFIEEDDGRALMWKRHCCQQCGTSSTTSKLFVCAACKQARYCSVACQKENWNSVHKAQCKANQATAVQIKQSCSEAEAAMMKDYEKWKPKAHIFLSYLVVRLLPLHQWKEAVIFIDCTHHPDALVKIHLSEAPTIVPILQLADILPATSLPQIMLTIDSPQKLPTAFIFLWCKGILRISGICTRPAPETSTYFATVLESEVKKVDEAIRLFNKGHFLTE